VTALRPRAKGGACHKSKDRHAHRRFSFHVARAGRLRGPAGAAGAIRPGRGEHHRVQRLPRRAPAAAGGGAGDLAGRRGDPGPAGGAAYLADAVRSLKERNPNSAVVSAGDLISASPLISAQFLDEPTILAMNMIGLDFNAVGNHEFDRGERS
jgi:hypothetical protein